MAGHEANLPDRPALACIARLPRLALIPFCLDWPVNMLISGRVPCPLIEKFINSSICQSLENTWRNLPNCRKHGGLEDHCTGSCWHSWHSSSHLAPRSLV